MKSKIDEEAKEDGTHFLLEHIKNNKEGRIIEESWRDVNNSQNASEFPLNNQSIPPSHRADKK